MKTRGQEHMTRESLSNRGIQSPHLCSPDHRKSLYADHYDGKAGQVTGLTGQEVRT